jgi:hypothetical protein
MEKALPSSPTRRTRTFGCLISSRHLAEVVLAAVLAVSVDQCLEEQHRATDATLAGHLGFVVEVLGEEGAGSVTSNRDSSLTTQRSIHSAIHERVVAQQELVPQASGNAMPSAGFRAIVFSMPHSSAAATVVALTIEFKILLNSYT